MYRISSVAIYLVLTGLLLSCAGTGGTIGGLIPAPKFLKGKVEGPFYYAPENAFTVRLPYPPTQSREDRNEWMYAKVNEIHDGTVIGVVFGPAAFDLNLYHAVIIREPMKEDKDAYVKTVFENKLKSRAATYTQKATQTFTLNGRRCYYSVYESDNSFLVLSLTDANSSFFSIEADISKQGARGRTNLEDLINRKWGAFNDMLESFTLVSVKP